MNIVLKDNLIKSNFKTEEETIRSLKVQFQLKFCAEYHRELIFKIIISRHSLPDAC